MKKYPDGLVDLCANINLRTNRKHLGIFYIFVNPLERRISTFS